MKFDDRLCFSNDALSSGGEKSSDRQIRVFVIDDHPAIREALCDTIAGQEDMVWSGEAGSASEAIDLIDEADPDVLVIDIALGDAHGLDLVRRLRASHPRIQMLIFSVYDETLYAERAIRAGALGYLMKSETTQSVVEAIRSVHRGDVYLSRRMASQILGKVVRRQRHNLIGTVEELTDRELSVFQMLGEGIGIDDIAERLSLSRKTVETYRRRAKEKLGFDSIQELIQYAVQWTYGRKHHDDA